MSDLPEIKFLANSTIIDEIRRLNNLLKEQRTFVMHPDKANQVFEFEGKKVTLKFWLEECNFKVKTLDNLPTDRLYLLDPKSLEQFGIGGL